MPSEIDIAWAAGLYEGEGTCVSYTNKGGYMTVRMRVVMTDREPIARFAEIVGRGAVGKPYRPPSAKPNHSATYTWAIDGWSTCAEVMELLWDHLSTRRKQQYTDILDQRDQMRTARAAI